MRHAVTTHWFTAVRKQWLAPPTSAEPKDSPLNFLSKTLIGPTREYSVKLALARILFQMKANFL